MDLNHHIVLVGLPCVGKTSIGKELSTILNISHLDVDNQIELEQKTTIDKFIKQNGMASFRVMERNELKSILNSTSPLVISSGGGIVLDPENQDLIINKSFGIHIKCALKEIEKRLDVSNRPLLYNTNKSEKLLDLWNERCKLYDKVAKIEIDITGMNINKAVLKVHNIINMQEQLIC